MLLQSVRGTRDLFETELNHLNFILQTIQKVADTYNYKLIETPIFEHTSVFQRTLGETSDIVGKEMYTFNDKGGDSLTLRPEGTAAVMRAIINGGLTQNLPQKRLYSGPMFRYERPQKGRYRQFCQAGIECIGSSSPYSDIEIIAMAEQILKKLNIQNYTLHLNTLGDLESRIQYRKALIHYFEQYKNDLSEDSLQRLDKNPLRILDSKDEKDRRICQEAPTIEKYLTKYSKIFFDTLCEGLEAINIEFTYDSFLVRGIDYYCHTAFEFKSPSLGSQGAICAGGRYDGLSQQMGGPALPSVGWGMGIDRLLLLDTPKIKENICVALIPIEDSMQIPTLQIAQQLRNAGIKTELYSPGNISKRFKQADKLGCRFALVLGSNEYAIHSIKVKDLRIDVSSLEKEKMILINDLPKYFSSFI